MNKTDACPRCGADACATGKFCFDSWTCGTWRAPASDAVVESVACCRRQLDALRAELALRDKQIGEFASRSESDLCELRAERDVWKKRAEFHLERRHEELMRCAPVGSRWKDARDAYRRMRGNPRQSGFSVVFDLGLLDEFFEYREVRGADLEP